MKPNYSLFLFLVMLSPAAFAQRTIYSIRVFNCDDGCRAYLDERLVGETGFGQDSGWIDISNRIGPGVAKLKFEVINRTGAIAYGIQVRVNSSVVLSEVCGKSGVTGCENDAQAPVGVAREFSYTTLPGADSTADSVFFEVGKRERRPRLNSRIGKIVKVPSSLVKTQWSEPT